MKYAFNTWTYGSFPVWLPSYPLEEVIRRLSAMGYDGIEIGCAAPHAWPSYLSADRRRMLRDTMEKYHLPVVSLLPAPGGGSGVNPASPIVEERAFTVDHYREVVDLAADLGANIVLYIAGWQIFGVTRLDCWKWSADCLRKIAEHAAGRGITIAIEPTSADSNLLDTADHAVEMMREIGQANVKVMFDTFHVLYRNEVSADYVRRMGRDLAQVHFADFDRSAPGDGVIDWEGVLLALDEIGFQGYVTMEIGFNKRSADPDALARRSLRFLKDLEAKLGLSSTRSAGSMAV
jgi:protein FrlC